MREASLERHLVDRTAALGGWALKFVSPGASGVPDRLVVVPTGQCPCCGRSASIGFLELKAPRQEPRPLQERQICRLAAMGAPVAWTSSHAGVAGFLAALVAPAAAARHGAQEATEGVSQGEGSQSSLSGHGGPLGGLGGGLGGLG